MAQVPDPAAAAKQRSRAAAAPQQQEQPQAVAAPGHRRSMEQLADAAAGEAKCGSPPGSGSEDGPDDGSGTERTGRLPAAGAIMRGPTFRLARGEEPPCFRIWLTLQAPCSAKDVTGGWLGGAVVA